MKNRYSRRSFLVTTGLASCAVWTAGRAAWGAPGEKMRLGLVTYLWGRDWDLPTLIANC